jgi:hypothetical protein
MMMSIAPVVVAHKAIELRLKQKIARRYGRWRACHVAQQLHVVRLQRSLNGTAGCSGLEDDVIASEVSNAE